MDNRPNQSPSESPSALYRIGDYAKNLGVTPDFLKHYEQYGLVESIQQPNGYRHYPFNQSLKVLECMRLRGYGIPVRDMSTILCDMDAQQAMDLLDARADELEQKIRFQQAVVDEQRLFSHWYRQIQQTPNDWCIQHGEAYLFLPHTNRRDFLKDPRVYEILESWTALMPMVKSCIRIPHGGSESSQDYAWGLIVRAQTAEAFHLPVNDAVLKIMPRKHFLYHFSEATWDALSPDHPRDTQPVYQKMSQMGLSPTGDTYVLLHMYTKISENPRYYGSYAIPID